MPAGTSYTTSFSSSRTLDILSVERHFTTFDLNGNTLTLASPASSNPITHSLQLGDFSAGQSHGLTLSDGAVDANVAQVNGSSTLTVDLGALLTTNNTLDVQGGGNGTAVVSATAGGMIDVPAIILDNNRDNVFFARFQATGGGSRIEADNIFVGDRGVISVSGAAQAHLGFFFGTGEINVASSAGAVTIGSNVFSQTFDGVLTGGGDVRKIDQSRQILTGTNNVRFSHIEGGAVVINGGSLDQTGESLTLDAAAGQAEAELELSSGATATTGTIFFGETSQGSLKVLSGSTLNSGLGFIGQQAGAAGDATVDGNGSTWTTSGDMFVGNNGAGSLTISTGGTVNNVGGRIGEAMGSSGSVTVTGAGSTWNNSNFLDVGNDGDGTLDVFSGGVVNSDRGFIGQDAVSTGTATVDGTDSQWNMTGELSIGDFGTGTLNVSSGGTVSVTNSSNTFVGQEVGSMGTLNVAGQGSAFTTNGNLSVGREGHGTMVISGRGTVTNAGGFIGDLSGSAGAVTVTGSGSRWTNTDFLDVGNDGNGTLDVLDGGDVFSDRGFIGQDAASTGTVNVDDSGSAWTLTGEFTVGDFGTGTLNVTNGGEVEVTNQAESFVGHESGSTGTVNVIGAGSEWLADGNIHVGYLGNGTLNVMQGGFVETDQMLIGSGADSTGVVSVDGSQSRIRSLDPINIGCEASGTLSISDAGRVDSFPAFLGSVAGRVGVFETGVGSVTIDGAGSRWRVQGDLEIGRLGTGSVLVSGGGDLFSDDADVGSESTGDGSVIVEGVGSTWDVQGRLFLGDSSVGSLGTGQLTIRDGGRVTVDSQTLLLTSRDSVTIDGGELTTGTFTNSAGGTFVFDDGELIVDGGSFSQGVGDLTLDGAGPMDNPTLTLRDDAVTASVNTFFVADTNRATLNITDGSDAAGTGAAIIGNASGSVGVVNVHGVGSTWSSDFGLSVGRGGHGTLNVTGGGQVFSNTVGVIGNGVGSMGGAVLIEGAGSMWTVGTTLTVGNGGVGSLDISAGGAVLTSGNGSLAESSMGAGDVTVDGEGSRWVIGGGLFVAGGQFTSGSNATLSVLNNGLVSVAGLTKTWSNATINLNGGTLDLQDLDLSAGGVFNFDAGTLLVSNVTGDLVQDGGSLEFGGNPSQTTVSGAYDLNAGALAIEVFAGGGSPIAGSDFNQVTADTATINGTLNLIASNSYLPTVGDTFVILDATNGMTGTFDTIIGRYLGGGFAFDVTYTANSVVLDVVAAQLGDFNLDGTVDSNDLTDPVVGWNTLFGVKYDLADLLDWQRNFGAGAPIISTQTVPEPAAGMLAAMAAAALTLSRKVHRLSM